MLMDKSYFWKNNVEILEEVKNKIRGTLSEEVIEELIHKRLAMGTFLKAGMGYTTYPYGFFEDLFWDIVIDKKPKSFLIEVIEEGEGKPFFEIIEEKEWDIEEEKVINLQDFLEKLNEMNSCINPQVFSDTIAKILKENDVILFVEWNEENLAILDYLINKGKYLIKGDFEGIYIKQI